MSSISYGSSIWCRRACEKSKDCVSLPFALLALGPFMKLVGGSEIAQPREGTWLEFKDQGGIPLRPNTQLLCHYTLHG